MNRILFEPGEIAGGRVTIADRRFTHMRDVLKSETGDIVKTGEIGGKTGFGKVIAMDGESATLELEHSAAAPEPWFDLILAPPRPRVFKRLLPQLTALGMRTLTLVGAQKVEKDFWGATILKEENYRPLLIEGLEQCGATRLPEIAVRRNMRKFFEETPEFAGTRLIAHPYSIRGSGGGSSSFATLAVGPEGGWTESEVALFEAHGFSRISLGPRILRTDTALLALIGKLM